MYKLTVGSVRPMVTGFKTSPRKHHFGPAEYDRNLSILSEYLKKRAVPIVADLNSGIISESQARSKLRAL